MEEQRSSRSYIVRTSDDKTFRRSRVDLNKFPTTSESGSENATLPVQKPDTSSNPETPILNDGIKRSRYGRAVKPPDRFDPSA